MNTEKIIQEIMTTNLVAVAPEDSFGKVKLLFDENDFHHLLVVNEKKELVGIISLEDLWRTAYHVSFLTTGTASSLISDLSVVALSSNFAISWCMYLSSSFFS